MTRKNYRITTRFTYKDGTTKGTLDTVVNSKKAIDIQLKANQEWLDHKGHIANKTIVIEA